MEFIRKNWKIIILLSVLLGAGLKFYYGNFELNQRTVTEVVKGKTVSKQYYVREVKYSLADIASDLLLSFSFALLISIVFIRSFEAAEKTKFENIVGAICSDYSFVYFCFFDC